MCTHIREETSRLQYNFLLVRFLLVRSTIWRNYGIINGKLRKFILVAMEMEKL